jgi:cytoskeletal protein CcmA (bactofilin family)
MRMLPGASIDMNGGRIFNASNVITGNLYVENRSEFQNIIVNGYSNLNNLNVQNRSEFQNLIVNGYSNLYGNVTASNLYVKYRSEFENLIVNGSSNLNGNVTASNLYVKYQSEFQNLIVYGYSNLYGNITASNLTVQNLNVQNRSEFQNLIVNGYSNLNGNVTASNLYVKYQTEFENLIVNGSSNLYGNLTTSNLYVKYQSEFENLIVHGYSTLYGNLRVESQSEFQDIIVNGYSNLYGSLYVQDESEFESLVVNKDITTGNLIVEGYSNLYGNVTMFQNLMVDINAYVSNLLYATDIQTTSILFEDGGLDGGGGGGGLVTEFNVPITFNGSPSLVATNVANFTNVYIDDSLIAFETINIVDFTETRRVYIGQTDSIAIGLYSGQSQGEFSIALGGYAGQVQNNYTVAIGQGAGSNQSQSAIAIGKGSGFSQDLNAIAIGLDSGYTQNTDAIAIGFSSGFSQNTNSIAIGTGAGQTQSVGAVAIGAGAGLTQGNHSIAIGTNTVTSNTGSIVLNASGSSFGSQVDNAFYVNPIRTGTTQFSDYAYALGYTSSKEVIQAKNLALQGHLVAKYGLTPPFTTVSDISSNVNLNQANPSDIGGRFRMIVNGSSLDAIGPDPGVYGLANVVFGYAYTETPAVVITPGNIWASQLAPFVQVYPGYFQVCTTSSSVSAPLSSFLIINYTVMGLF